MSANLRYAAILGWAALTVGFHLYLIFSGLLPNLITRPMHLLLALPWIFIVGATGPRLVRAAGTAIGLGGMAGCLYIMLDRDRLLDQYGSLGGLLQYAVAVLLIAVVLEMARRAIKPVLPSVALVVLLYGLFGDLLPGELGHGGIPLDSFLGTLVIAEGGLWGELTGISVNVVAVFLILGAVVSAGEAGAGFMALAGRLAGQYRAGGAKVAVLASAMYGTISGSASANVASVRTITIPTMKRLGYPASFAAAVEAVASSGGQIMPPIMGAGAFLMAEMLHVTYADIMVAAVLPAILFFFVAWVGCHLFSYRLGLVGLPSQEVPSWAAVGRTLPFFLLPFGILLAMLALTDYTAQYAAVVASAVTALLLLFDGEGRIDVARWGSRLARALIDASQQMAMIAAVIICAGIIVGVLHQTGLGIKATSLILSLSDGRLWPALALTALACILLGMEVPTTAAYVICISVAGPALVSLGLGSLDAHLFVFWYALLSTITPPVCGTVYIAAGIANTPWLPVAATAMRLGLGLFLVPPAFIINPALLRPDADPALALAAALKVGIGVALLSYAFIGTGGARWKRLGAFIGGTVSILALPL
ncbi:MAG: TRAP transporter fused permease subunit [Proteobacteria bacterium]|nr:TRAP transporter fused permease subunit [Pseudomonadota bacterium]